MKIIGLDIGGATTDLAILDCDENYSIKKISTDFEYYPLWLNKDISNFIQNLVNKNTDTVDAIGISMTAELVDAYKTKKEGILNIINNIQNIFKCPIMYVTINGMVNSSKAYNDPLSLAAANWIATSKLISSKYPNCIFVDMGSTTTDIIPIINKKESSIGKTDLDRLCNNELVYTGVLRTNLATIVDKVPFNNYFPSLSSEFFAITADLYTVLEEIDSRDYICDTPDGMGKTKHDSMRRIARILCSDLDTLSFDDIFNISEFISNKQISLIATAIQDVSKRNNLNLLVLTGLGQNILIKKLAPLLKDMEIITFSQSKDESTVASAIGTAYMMLDYLQN